jgi:hypothetical protein
LVTAPLPVAPLIPVVGPAAVSVQAVGSAVPPLLFVTVFTSVNDAGWSSLTMVQVADCPMASVIDAPACVPPAHDQADAV